jgi:hypothetical protein
MLYALPVKQIVFDHLITAIGKIAEAIFMIRQRRK